jgi:hypothetical protein
VRACDEAGVEFETVHTPTVDEVDGVYARILDVETRSWKGRDEVGIDRGTMRAFYQLMIHRLARRNSLRVMFARRDGRDLGYILGGVLDDTYRGLQFSYDASCGQLSLGGNLQYRQLVQLCDAGYGYYDLGMRMEYKRRWAEQLRESIALVAVNEP